MLENISVSCSLLEGVLQKWSAKIFFRTEIKVLMKRENRSGQIYSCEQTDWDKQQSWAGYYGRFAHFRRFGAPQVLKESNYRLTVDRYLSLDLNTIFFNHWVLYSLLFYTFLTFLSSVLDIKYRNTHKYNREGIYNKSINK